MKILFTGAIGVIGSQTLPLLIADGHDVSALCRGEAEKKLWRDSPARSWRRRPSRTDRRYAPNVAL